MREIKFRAWDKEKGKMFEPTFRAYAGELEELHISLDGRLGLRKLDGYHDQSMFPERFELMQYTGLKDKNGVEIYEGDIVRFTNNIDEIDNEVGKVTWEQSECNFVAQYKTANCVTQEENGTTITIYLISNETYRECVEYEVIGNIYENIELLEEAE